MGISGACRGLWGRGLWWVSPMGLAMSLTCPHPSFFPLPFSLTSPPHSTLSIPFPSPLEAQIAHGSLAPDPEPRKGGISKELTVTENFLHVHWKADEARILRVSISSFLDHLSLVIETMEMFGPPVPR